MNTGGSALSGAAIALDTAGGVALVGGALWLVLNWKRSRKRAAEGLRAKAGEAAAGSVGWLRTAAQALLARAYSPHACSLFPLRFRRWDPF